MPKRPCSDDETVQPIKKHQFAVQKSRKIRSNSSERALQLLYEGAAKSALDKKEQQNICTGCSKSSSETGAVARCSFCEIDTCFECNVLCYKCKNDFCQNCSFPTYDHNVAACYSCYS